MKRGVFIASVLIGEAASIVLAIVNTYMPGRLMDSFVINADKSTTLFLIFVLSGAFFVCNSIMGICNNNKEFWYMIRRDQNAKRLTEAFANSRLERFETYNFDKRGVLGEFIARGSDKKIIEALVNIVSKLCLSIFLTGFFIINYKHVYMCVLVMGLASIDGYVTVLYDRLDYNLREKFAEIMENIHKTIWSMTKCDYAKEIRVYHLEKFMGEKFESARKKLYHMIDEKNNRGAIIDSIPSLKKGLEIFVSFGFAVMIKTEGISIGEVLICANMLGKLFESTGNIVQSGVVIKNEKKYQTEFEEFCTMDVGRDKGNAQTISQDAWTVEFKDVTFSYPNSERPALDRVNLIIRPGEKIALVGENGAGKSTFIKLLAGHYKPSKGNIYINGLDLESLDLREYHNNFSIIYQDFSIFDYSIFENIKMRFRNKDEETENLDQEARKIGLLERINSAEKRYDTLVTRRFDMNGIELSGGEKQKIAIMRAMQKPAKFIVFDEPTSAMSPMAENEIYSLYGDIVEGKTAVYISHRLAGCKLSDRILVFDKGKIVEDGTHDLLVGNKEGYYYKLFMEQAGGYIKYE